MILNHFSPILFHMLIDYFFNIYLILSAMILSSKWTLRVFPVKNWCFLLHAAYRSSMLQPPSFHHHNITSWLLLCYILLRIFITNHCIFLFRKEDCCPFKRRTQKLDTCRWSWARWWGWREPHKEVNLSIIKTAPIVILAL